MIDGLLVVGTGTAVTFFFTREMDLFFVAGLCTGREFGGCRERRVLTFPSGWLLMGKFDRKLFVSPVLLLMRSGLGGAVPVGRGKDAEGDGDTGLKVQVGGLRVRERIFSYNPP